MTILFYYHIVIFSCIQAVTIQSGPFRQFPGYFTELANINYERANLLADFTGWMVKNNAAQYAAALGIVVPPLPPPPSPPSPAAPSSSDEGSNKQLSDGEVVIVVFCSVLGFALLVAGVYYFVTLRLGAAKPSMAATDASAHNNGGHTDIEMNRN